MASGDFWNGELRCIKILLLLVKGGMPTAKNLIMKISENCIDVILNNNRDQLKCARKKKAITEKQMNILFPGSSKPTDMECWDISLLSYILLNLFHSKLKSGEKRAIEELRHQRNDMAHLAPFRLTEVEFLRRWTHLTSEIMELCRGLTKAEHEDIKVTIDCILKIEDKNLARKQLKPFEGNDESLCEISTRRVESYDQCLTKILKFMDEMKTFKDKMETFLDLKARITVDGSSYSIRDMVHEILFNETKRYVSCKQDQSGEEDTCKDDEVQTNIKHFFSEMREKGVDIVNVEEGSIVVTFRCPTISALKNISQYLADRMYEDRLIELENALSKRVGSAVKLNISIVLETLESALMQIVRKYKYLDADNIEAKLDFSQPQTFSEKEANNKHIVLTMKCKGSKGVKNAIDCFGYGSSTNALYSLSEALSRSVAQRVELQTTIDVDKLENDIKELNHQSLVDDQHSVPKSVRPIIGWHQLPTDTSLSHSNLEGCTTLLEAAKKRQHEIPELLTSNA